MTFKPAVALSTFALLAGGGALTAVTAYAAAAKPNPPATDTIEYTGVHVCAGLATAAAKKQDSKVSYRFSADGSYCFKTISK